MENELKEILEAFKWTFDNMGTPHTSDHFNIPANGIKMLEDLLDCSSREVSEITKASVDYALKLPKGLEPITVAHARKAFEAGAKWNQERIDNLEESLCKCEKQLELMIDNYYGNEI